MHISPEEHRLKLHGISISGLSVTDRERIAAVGFDAWLDEIGATKPTPAPTTAPAIPQTATKRCTLKSNCLNARNRRGAPVAGAGEYCSAACRGAARALRSREKAEWAAANPEMVQ
jgi:hypothetical protein